MIHSVVWRRIDKPGHEYCLLTESETGNRMSGVTIVSNDGVPHCVEYEVQCDAYWNTLRCKISEHGDTGRVDFDVRREPHGWTLNGVDVTGVMNCGDIDLGFSPSTNLLPIRRLKLEIGASAVVRAAWVRFPDFTLEPLEQTYTRLDGQTYRYESDNGRFKRDLKVNETGFVLDYPDMWIAESFSR